LKFATVFAIRDTNSRGKTRRRPAIHAATAVILAPGLARITNFCGNHVTIIVGDGVEPSISAQHATTAYRSVRMNATSAIFRAFGTIEDNVANLVGFYSSVSTSRALSEFIIVGNPTSLATLAIAGTALAEAVASFTGIEIAVSATRTEAVHGDVDVIVATTAILQTIQVGSPIANFSVFSIEIYNTISATSASESTLRRMFDDVTGSTSSAIGRTLQRSGVAIFSLFKHSVSAKRTTKSAIRDGVGHATAAIILTFSVGSVAHFTVFSIEDSVSTPNAFVL
jgi:hypothetical protein